MVYNKNRNFTRVVFRSARLCILRIINFYRIAGEPKICQTSIRKKAIEITKDYFNTIIWPKKRKETLG